MLAIAGASGSGKSTIVQLLARYDSPQSGSILLNGMPLAAIEGQELTRRIAVVFQEPFLFPGTIQDNLRFGRSELSDEAVIQACRMTQLHDTIMEMSEQYQTLVGERGGQLSGGQRQRIAIARALLGDPDLLILDEATSQLDAETEQHVMNEIYKARKGKTTVVIAHRLSAIQLADCIAVLENGQIAEEGTHEQLRAYGQIYPRLYAAEMAVG